MRYRNGLNGKVWWVFHCGLWIIYLYYQVCLLSTLQQTEILLAKVTAFRWGYNSVTELTEHKQGSGSPELQVWPHYDTLKSRSFPDTQTLQRQEERICTMNILVKSEINVLVTISYLSTQTSWQTPINKRTPVHLWWSLTSWFDRNSVRLT